MPKVLVFSTDGDFLQAWNTSTLEMPHGILLSNASSNPTVWITDVGNGEEPASGMVDFLIFFSSNFIY